MLVYVSLFAIFAISNLPEAGHDRGICTYGIIALHFF